MESHWEDDGFDEWYKNQTWEDEILREREWYEDSFDEWVADMEEPQTGGVVYGPVDILDLIDFTKIFKLGICNKEVSKKYGVIKHKWENVQIAPLPYVFNHETSMRLLPLVFDAIFNLTMHDFNPKDRIIIELNCEGIDKPIFLAKKFENFNSLDFLKCVEMIIQSGKSFNIDQSFTLKITRCTLPTGGSSKRKYTHDTSSRKRFAGSIVTVHVTNNLCLPAALFLGEYRLTHQIKAGEKHFLNWKILINKKNTIRLENHAVQLTKDVGLSPGHQFDFVEDLALFQREKFKNYQIVVISEPMGNVVVARHPKIKTPGMEEIIIYFNNKHFDLITTKTGFFQTIILL